MSQLGPVAGGLLVAAGAVGGQFLAGTALAGASASVLTELLGAAASSLFGQAVQGFLAGRNRDIEKSMHAAARMALGELRKEAAGEFDEWFEDWDKYLKVTPAEEVFSGTGDADATALQYDDDAFRLHWWQQMEPTLLRWRTAVDSKARLHLDGMPEGLRELLRSRLPERMREAHDIVLRDDKLRASWIAFQEHVHRKTLNHLLLIQTKLDRIEAKIDGKVAAKTVWTIPRPTQNFQDRPDLIEKIDAALEKRSATALTALHGLGGIGKTQLARRYAEVRRDRYAAGAWIASEGVPSILTSFAGLAPMLGVAVQQDQEATATLVMSALCEREPWLVVFDNAVTAADVRPFVERLNGDGHVLITSRDEHWDGVAERVSVTQWSVEESVKFLLSRTGQTDRASAEALARELDGLVLALEHAAAYMRSGEVALAEYLRTWRERLGKTPGGHEYQRSVAAALGMSLDAVSRESATAYGVLCLFAWLAPDRIPKKELLEAGAEALPEGLANAWADGEAWTEAIETLARYSLVRRERVDGLTVGYAVHRVVQQVMRERMGSEGERWFAAACDVVNEATPYDSDEPPFWATMEALLQHVRAIKGFVGQFGVPESLDRLLSQSSLYLQVRGLYTETREFREVALNAALQQYGPEHTEVAADRSNLAVILRRLGKNKEARKQLELALESDLRQFGPDHPSVAVHRSHLANVLYDSGETEEARKQNELALESDLRQFGPDHTKVTERRANLANILSELGKHPEALKQIEFALESALRQFGPSHPHVASCRSSLSVILRNLGEYQEARRQVDLALEATLQQLGPDHPNVGIIRGILAAILFDMGEFRRALVEIEQAVAVFRTKLPDGHPQTKSAEESRDIILGAIAKADAASAE